MSDLKIIHEDIREIKAHVIKLVELSAVHNHILAEHEKRSTSLEIRVVPLEKDHYLRQKLVTIIFSSGGVLALIAALIKLLSATR